MGWGRFLLLGDFGQQMDLTDQRQAIDAMRSELASGRDKDLDQDREIDALWRENTQLKLCVGSLANLLVSKGVLSSAELSKLAAALETRE